MFWVPFCTSSLLSTTYYIYNYSQMRQICFDKARIPFLQTKNQKQKHSFINTKCDAWRAADAPHIECMRSHILVHILNWSIWLRGAKKSRVARVQIIAIFYYNNIRIVWPKRARAQFKCCAWWRWVQKGALTFVQTVCIEGRNSYIETEKLVWARVMIKILRKSNSDTRRSNERTNLASPHQKMTMMYLPQTFLVVAKWMQDIKDNGINIHHAYMYIS